MVVILVKACFICIYPLVSSFTLYFPVFLLYFLSSFNFFWIPCHSNSPLYLLLKSSVFFYLKKKVSTPSSFYDFLLSSYCIYCDCTFSLIGYFYQAGAISFLSHTISRLNNECLINFELRTIVSKKLKLFVLNIVSIL